VPTAPKSGLAAILSAADLAKLRTAFDNDTMIAAGIGAVSGSYDRALPMTMISASQFYAEKGSKYASTDPQLTRVMARADIERVLLTTLLMTHQRWAFAIHVYWAMMVEDEPLSPGEIAEIVLLCSMYGGLAVQSEGTNVLQAVFTTLKARLDGGLAVDARSCVGAIMQLVPITPGTMYALRG
jgi:hypothetical protein